MTTPTMIAMSLYFIASESSELAASLFEIKPADSTVKPAKFAPEANVVCNAAIISACWAALSAFTVASIKMDPSLRSFIVIWLLSLPISLARPSSIP